MPETELASTSDEDVSSSAKALRRYTAITLIASPTTFILFWLLLSATDWHPTLANLAVASLLVPPTYASYRKFVWSTYTPESLGVDVSQYWAVTLVNVLVASVCVAIASAAGANNSTTTVTLFAAYAALWLIRFAYFDRVQFRRGSR